MAEVSVDSFHQKEKPVIELLRHPGPVKIHDMRLHGNDIWTAPGCKPLHDLTKLSLWEVCVVKGEGAMNVW